MGLSRYASNPSTLHETNIGKSAIAGCGLKYAVTQLSMGEWRVNRALRYSITLTKDCSVQQAHPRMGRL